MDAEHERIERLREALSDLAAQDAGELLADARTQARARVRQILTDALADSLLDRLEEQLRPQPSTPEPRVSAPRANMPPAPSPEPTELGWYVYGVVGAETAPAWTAAGIDSDHPVTVLAEGSVAAVASRVALSEFGEERLREHLADMGWVETIARAHEEVLEQTRAQVTVIPMRMCTVYRSEARVREMLRREAAALTEALVHLSGKTEMGVKVFADRDRAQASLEPEREPSSERPASGTAYMEHRRWERDRADAVDQRLEEVAAAIHERLGACAVDGLAAPPQRPEASGHPGEMILNGVYLLEDDALDRFEREVAALQDEYAAMGLELVLTGPWPAYNFVPDTIGANW
jgi:hypothetical protein